MGIFRASKQQSELQKQLKASEKAKKQIFSKKNKLFQNNFKEKTVF